MAKTTNKSKQGKRKFVSKELQKAFNEVVADQQDYIEAYEGELANFDIREKEEIDAIKGLYAERRKTRKQYIEEAKNAIADAAEAAEALEPLMKLKTSAEVEKFLKARKIKGIRRNSSKCPIAQYLSRTAPNAAKDNLTVDEANVELDGITVKCTKAMTSFIAKFDEGEIPEVDVDPKVDDE
jgi:hypothetical protein